MIIYDGALESGWQKRAWGAADFANPAPLASGTASIKVADPGTGSAAFRIGHEPLAAAPYKSLTFQIYPTLSSSNVLEVRATGPGGERAGPLLSFAPEQVNRWQSVTIPLASLGLGSGDSFDGIAMRNNTGQPVTYYLDSIGLEPIPIPDPVTLKIDPSAVVRRIDSRLFGINVAIWDPFLSGTSELAILRAMGTQAIRFPGGSAADDFHWAEPGRRNRRQSNAATFARLAEKLGAKAFVTVNYGSGTPEEAAAWVAYYNADPSNMAPIGPDSRGRDWGTAGHWAGLRAAAPLDADDGLNYLRMAHPAPFGFQDWEIGNECYGLWEKDLHGVNGSGLGGQPHDAATYGRVFQAFCAKMRAVDPAIHIGAVTVPRAEDFPQHDADESGARRGWTPVMLATLKSEGVMPDFLIHHYYAENPGLESDPFLLQAAARLKTDAASLRGLAVEALGASGSAVELDVTELNSVTNDPGKQASNLVNALFEADAIGQIANTQFNACTWWDLRNGPDRNKNNSPLLYGARGYGDYGVVSGNGHDGNAMNPNFYAAKLLSQWAHPGDAVLKAESNYVLLSAYAVRTADGGVSLLVINKNPAADVSARIELGGFKPGRQASVRTYGKPNDTSGDEILVRTEMPGTEPPILSFPAYSASIITFEAR